MHHNHAKIKDYGPPKDLYNHANEDKVIWKKQSAKTSNKNGTISFIFTPGFPTISPVTAFSLLFFLGITEAALINQHRNEVKALCTDSSILAPNKPNITLGAQNGLIIPSECWQKPNCAALNQFFAFYTQANTPEQVSFFQHKSDKRNVYQNWAAKFEQRLEKFMHIVSKLDPATSNHFMALITSIDILKKLDMSLDTIKQTTLGSCQEQNDGVISALLLKKLQYNLPLKIQTVKVEAMSQTNKNSVQDHIFVLLDSSIPDTTIRNNINEVTKILNSMTGYICDKWNRVFGKVSDLSNSVKGFYSTDVNWHSIEIESVNIDLSLINHLPRQLRRFICQELKELGIFLEYHPKACSAIFKNKESQAQDSIDHENAANQRSEL